MHKLWFYAYVIKIVHIRLQGFKTDTRLLSYLAPRLEPIKLFSLLNYVRRSHFSAQANIETAV